VWEVAPEQQKDGKRGGEVVKKGKISERGRSPVVHKIGAWMEPIRMGQRGKIMKVKLCCGKSFRILPKARAERKKTANKGELGGKKRVAKERGKSREVPKMKQEHGPTWDRERPDSGGFNQSR